MPEEQPDLTEDPTEENEDDVSVLDLAAVRSATTAGTDWTTETILRRMRVGNIDLNPDFQRRDVWTPRKKSEFIESILLNLPIPQLVLAARRDDPNTFLVLDGKQRLLSLRQFAADPSNPEDDGFEPLRLTGLQIRDDLNGQTLSTLRSAADKNAFDNHTIRTVVIRGWSSDSFLYRVFLRLNTGSVKLSPQELRQALQPGPFTDFVDKYATKSEAIKRALRITRPDRRMADTEVFIRYLAFANALESYSGNLSPFLDDFCALLNRQWQTREQQIYDQLAACEAAIDATIEIFGQDHAFSRWRRGRYERPFNRAVFDVMTYFFRHEGVAVSAISRRDSVENAFKELCESDGPFESAISATTKTVGAISYRIRRWGETLQGAIGTTIDMPHWLVQRSESFQSTDHIAP